MALVSPATARLDQDGGVLMEPGHPIDIRNTAHFCHVYAGDQPEMRFSAAEIKEIRRPHRERAAGGAETAFRKFFRRGPHASLAAAS
jgi:hypothetical protein